MIVLDSEGSTHFDGGLGLVGFCRTPHGYEVKILQFRADKKLKKKTASRHGHVLCTSIY